MGLVQKLTEDDIALLEVFEDKVWLVEFLRNTADGEVDTNLHPKEKWKYRDYQKQFLTDETEFIVYTGGRAIGKCSPGNARILVAGHGYMTLSQVAKLKSFTTYALTPDMTVEQRRAICVPDLITEAYTVTTESGHKFVGTEVHPILTPDGYRLIKDLKPGDYAAVATKLPHESNTQALRWHELRYLGYFLLNKPFTAERKIKPKYAKIANELEVIADRMLVGWHKDELGNYTLVRRKGPFPHPGTSLYRETGLTRQSKYGAVSIPDIIKQERLENITVFIEALFAQYATISSTEVTLDVHTEKFAYDIQELLLRFGIETKLTVLGDSNIISTANYQTTRVELLNYRAFYRFFNTFNIPGVRVGKLRLPPATTDATEYMRFDRISSIETSHRATNTFAVYVYEFNNYIGDNFYVHNSVVLEDKMVYEILNNDLEFPVTPEMLLVTPNRAQLTPLQGKIILRFTASKLLKDFLKNQVNKADGIFSFPIRAKPFLLYTRIAGSKGENNLVGLHIPRIHGDEMQLFPLNAWTQMQPTYNSWEPKRQQVHAGVPNGLRNSVLYVLDTNTPKYKKYHIPSHNNPFYTREDDEDNLRKYGGENDDRYQQLVLGKHGSAAFQVIPRETIITETYPMYNFRYNSAHKLKGKSYKDMLELPALPKDLDVLILAMDTGFVDSSIYQLIGRDKLGVWRTYVRYRLNRIDFLEQEQVIDWIASYYQVDKLAIDIGAGGGGAGIMHHLLNEERYKSKKYNQRIIPVQFKENIVAGLTDEGDEVTQEAKSYAAEELAKIIQEGTLVFSELDNEGLSQMERVAKQKGMGGRDRYFVLSATGAGADNDDHIFASFICFVLAVREPIIKNEIKKLGKPTTQMT